MTYHQLYPDWIKGGLAEAQASLEQAEFILKHTQDLSPYHEEVANMVKIRKAVLKIWQTAWKELN